MAGDTRSLAARVRTAERQRQVLELRLRGASFEDIAAQLKLTISGAFRAYQRALRLTPESPLTLKRKEQQQRLDRARTRLWPRFGSASNVKELAQLNREIVRLEQREAKFFGLDTPQRSSTSQDAAELAQLKAEQLQQRQENEQMLALVRMMSNEERAAYLELMESAEARIKRSKGGNNTPSTETPD